MQSKKLVVAVMHKVWIEDRVERKSPKYTIGLNVVQIARVKSVGFPQTPIFPSDYCGRH